MVTKYYVAIRPQTNEHHAVHKANCPFLPDDEKRIYLGTFGSGQDAIKEGQRHFPESISCLFCLKEHQPEKKENVLTGIDITGDIPTADQVSQYQDGAMFYFLN